MNGHSSPQMMVAKPKQRNTFLRDNSGLGLGTRVWFLFFHYISSQILVLLTFDCS